ncbi:MAG: threonylcarbamoyl-AMP synthase [Gemmataceae bacterium]|nr:threonylcarbamoyl-AMP synthase [Gemmataceae bacterium]
MKTEVWRIDPEQPDETILARAAEILRRGGLVAMPTETVYGLAANALDAEAVRRIFQAKGRPATNPVIVHVPDFASAEPLTERISPQARLLAERFWPGPLTLVLPKSEKVPDVVTAGGSTVAIRVPAHPVALGLLRAAKMPLAAPSANRSNALSPTRPDHVLRGLEGRIDAILDAGATAGGIESTVVDLTCDPPRLLRPGLIAPAEIESVIGSLARTASSEGPLRSPGMLAKHYAPNTPLELSLDAKRRAIELSEKKQRVGLLLMSDSGPNNSLIIVRTLPADPRGYAAGLFAALHELDDAGVGCIVVEAPPEGDAWLGVHDRLARASQRG